MTGKLYKSSQGATIDMGALMLKNENTPAVGNMGVTAAGKKIPRAGIPEPVRNPAPRPVPRNRPSNVVKQVPDTTGRAARERLRAEADRLRAMVAASFIEQNPDLAPADTEIDTAVSETVQQHVAAVIASESTSEVNPLLVQLDASDTEVPQRTGGLADALARVRANTEEK